MLDNMSTTSEFLTGSPISNVPNEILQEIFTHCLLQNPLGHLQPDTTVAPILLCHVCSSWRMVALAFPILWTHLSWQLNIAGYSNTDSTSWTITYDERDIEYIRWWRRNQGSVAPFLSLEMWYDDDDGDLEDYLGNEMAGDGMDFLLEYIASAQYLELDNFFWRQVYLKIRAGYQVAVPNLHTLIFEPEWMFDHPFYFIEALIPSQTSQSVLRRLSIVCEDATLGDLLDVPNYWSTLTHISLQVGISLKFWFSFVREVQGLRWAHFQLATLVGSLDYLPAQHTLPRMTTLSVAVQNEGNDEPAFPLSVLFTGLHLPSLRTLTLSSHNAQSWKDDRAITELYNVLKSAPAITKLVLENKFLNLGVDTTAVLLAGVRGQGPVWNRAVQLTHLQLDVPYIGPSTGVEEEESILNIFVHNIFSARNEWLDLQNRACPIRTITMCTARSSFRTRDLVMAKIQNHFSKTPHMVFQITSDSAHAVVAEVRNDWIWGR